MSEPVVALGKQLPSLEFLRDLFRLDPTSKSYLRRVSTRSHRAQAGYEVGVLSEKGYFRVSIDGKWYPCHRIVWSMANGRLVDTNMEIDHVNGIRSDNRPENLRACSRSENAQNVKMAQNAGTYWDPYRNRWKARVMKDQRWFYAGTFTTREEAHAAYLAMKASIHPFSQTERIFDITPSSDAAAMATPKEGA